MNAFVNPILSADAEQEERENMTEAELDQIRRDLYGDNSDFVETEEMRLNGPVRLKEALNEIPKPRKRAYLEALQTNPRLVDVETPPLVLLRRFAYDVWAAADGLVKYWRLRKQLFGKRAFLPMVALEGGALDEEDMQLLRLGAIQRLPNDANGRAILYYDKGKFSPSGFGFDTMARCLFYLLTTTVLECENAQKYGLVGIANLKHYNPSHFSRQFAAWSGEMLSMHALKCLHVCYVSHNSALDFLLPVIKQICGRYLRNRFTFHVGGNVEVVASLKQYGITEFPIQIGGGLTDADFRIWLDQHQTLERERFQQIANNTTEQTN